MGGCCLAALILMAGPRITAITIWLLTDWFSVFNGWFLPLLGFLFLPLTLLWCLAVQHWYGGNYGAFQIIVLILCILTDLSCDGSSAKQGSSSD